MTFSLSQSRSITRFQAALFRRTKGLCNLREARGPKFALRRTGQREVVAPGAAQGEPLYVKLTGYALAMRVMQSDFYKQLDAVERGDCDELVPSRATSPERSSRRSAARGDGWTKRWR
jgi:hypothetical protein